MELYYSERFKKDYKKLPFAIQVKADEKLKVLSDSFSYPSLRVKKMKKSKNIFEASITINYRIIFQIDLNILILLRIGTHDILEK